MAWKTDKLPIDYLKQRIKYYKKKKSTVINLKKDEFMIARHGGEENLQKLIDGRVKEIDEITKEFEDAVTQLEKIVKKLG